MLGFTYNYNQNAVRERGSAGDYMIRTDGSIYETNQTTIFADAMFKYNGFSFMGEYAKRSAEDEIAARFTTVEYESVTGALPTDQYTLGVNKFVVGIS